MERLVSESSGPVRGGLPESQVARLAWYQDAKFGLFVHFGAYAVAGVEASWSIMAPDLAEAMFGTSARISETEYERLPARFNPAGFDADAWVQAAADAGMRYIVITAKHHDGFCLFDAPGTDYKITNTPYGKDLCLELANACAKVGMPLGFYYSPPDMHHPGYRDTGKPATRNWTGEPKRKQWGEYLDYMESHIRKLLTGYGPVRILWFDGLANHGKYQPERFHRLIHELSPQTLINDRLGAGFDFITPEQFIPRVGIPARTGKPPSGVDPGGDGFFRLVCSLFHVPGVQGWLQRQLQKYGEGELELTPVHQERYPSPERFQPWETCMTMGRTWAYNPDETAWKAPRELVQNLVRVVSRGGNYLLNVGPAPSGEFPPEAVERLQQIGRWTLKYGDAIYGATYTPLQGQSWGEATRNGDCLYLHVVNWPADGALTVESMPDQARAVSLFEGGALPFRQEGGRLQIAIPAAPPDPDVSVLTVGIDGKEKNWSEFSAPVVTTVTPRDYIRRQATSSFIINAAINGLLAFLGYRTRGALPYGDVAVDVLISVFIIAFLNAWIAVGSTRTQIVKGNLVRAAARWRKLRLPQGAGLRALILTVLCVVGFGGLVVDGLIYLVSPEAVGNWAYIAIKTLYTGASGALAIALGILSVLNEPREK